MSPRRNDEAIDRVFVRAVAVVRAGAREQPCAVESANRRLRGSGRDAVATAEVGLVYRQLVYPTLEIAGGGFFGGSEISDSTYFADRIVAPYHARAIVMYAGDNDLQDGVTPEQVRDDFAAFVRKARSVDPGVPIAFIAIKPSVARALLLPKIRQANALVREYASSQTGVSYLDVFTPMLGSNGGPQSGLFGNDGLHMNRRGYQLWIGVIKPWLDAIPR